MTKTSKLGYRELSMLCLELSLFLKAGADGNSALVLLAEDEENPRRKERFLSMVSDMDSGLSLSAAMERSGLFPRDVWTILAVGEKTGRTEEALVSVSRHYDAKDRRDRQMRAALLQPSILLLVMLCVILVLLVKILPIFNEVYLSLGGEMSGIAGGLLRLGMLIDGILPIVCLLLGLAAGAILLFASVERLREAVFRLFKSKKKLSAGDRAHFAGALAMGISSGLTAVEAVEAAAELLAEGDASAALCRSCLAMLTEGKTLAEALSVSGLLPTAECRLLALGIRSGSGEAAIEEIARRLEVDAEEQLERRIGQIEPAMVVITSVLIGLILLCVMLPLTQIMSAIG
ncbi:MAG: type II secretion system F family protein [Clostridia bacterium]|nr:type II secretion system F family protein [Clostridia bacterium]